MVEQVTEKGKPSAMVVKRFESEIKRIAGNKIKVIYDNYPLKNTSDRNIICSGGGRLRNATELRACIKANRYSNDSLRLEQIFDIEKEKKIIKKENEEIQKFKDKTVSKINTDARDIINLVYFGETDLVQLLKEFNDKEYT